MHEYSLRRIRRVVGEGDGRGSIASGGRSETDIDSATGVHRDGSARARVRRGEVLRVRTAERYVRNMKNG